MTPDLAEIRAALTAATPRHPDIENADYDRLVANAPTWLASLCDEVERLRGEWGGVPMMTLDAVATRHVEVLRERDAALARVAELEALIADDVEHGPWWKGET